MADVIQLLPDSVANQIAAGEVIQRPASVIKELVENAVDAGANAIKIIVKDAGKTLIQVIDNGKGMSPTDARMAFERHATSKISNADDLFRISTKGFRGEALASIAAIAHVELRTRTEDSELGTLIGIEGSKIMGQEAVACASGSNFSVRNLFYNTPARRKFLKGDNVELRHIISEVQRVALAHPQTSFGLWHNDAELLNLPEGSYKQRIVTVFGKQINKDLLRIETQTEVVRIHGYVGKPEFARKRSADQFLFVNDRYFKSGYFHRAVMNAYEPILAQGMQPTYFVYFEVDSENIDVNIHPTKTEIKFAEGSVVFQILEVAVREALGKMNVVPAMDFGERGLIDIPSEKPDGPIFEPQISHNPDYNPFDSSPRDYRPGNGSTARPNAEHWEKFYEDFENAEFPEFPEMPRETAVQTELDLDVAAQEKHSAQSLMQYKNRYVVTAVKSGLMFIDQKRAHERILYDLFLSAIEQGHSAMQRSLYPRQISVSSTDAALLLELIPNLRAAGFEIDAFGQNSFVIQATPAELPENDAETLLMYMIAHYRRTESDPKLKIKERIALALARSASIEYGRSLSVPEMQALLDNLFACPLPNFTADGQTVIAILAHDELEKKFK